MPSRVAYIPLLLRVTGANDTRYGLNFTAADFLNLSLGCSLDNQRQRPAAFCSSFDMSIYWVPAKIPLFSSDRNVKRLRLYNLQCGGAIFGHLYHSYRWNTHTAGRLTDWVRSCKYPYSLTTGCKRCSRSPPMIISSRRPRRD